MRESFNASNHHFFGEFNFEKCRRRQRSQGGNVGCCGEYPNRRPFSSDTKVCCANKIVNKCDQEQQDLNDFVNDGTFDDGTGRRRRRAADFVAGNYNEKPAISSLTIEEDSYAYDIDETLYNYEY